MGANSKFVLLDGLNYSEQAELIRDYEKRSGRAFRCAPCVTASARTTVAEELAGEVVVILVGEKGGMMPLCEACYERLVEEERESGWTGVVADAVRA